MIVQTGTIFQNTRERQSLEVKREVRELTKRSQKILFRVSSFFPFELFPTELTVDENKVNVTYKSPWGVEQIRSIPIQDVFEVIAETGPFFATLEISPRKSYSTSSIVIHYLKRTEAIHARRIIEGLIICTEKGVDFSKMDTHDCLRYVDELGRARELE